MSKYYYGFIDQFIDLGFICTISKCNQNRLFSDTRYIILSLLSNNEKYHCTIEVLYIRQDDGSLLRNIKMFNNCVKIKDVSGLYNKDFNDELKNIINILYEDCIVK